MVVTCNCFTISNGEMQDVGVGLYPSMSLLNHSCDPNCVIIFEGYQLLLRSVREIQIGEELTVSYIESLMPTSERQEQLKRQYCFECDCCLCQDQEKIYVSHLSVVGADPSVRVLATNLEGMCLLF
ncbi:histone-lysine N-methyltransferase SMYD3-like [Meleagris gallopavo]|uniref:histone-lysine N-methyltransferase SMYD3-like n=1 Tax=Meleagris gallopavo TaxID=9103 RepID=UPI000549B11E|nr:histone-lysine N-methyltransferase SMYD3-like [Meleagris gallopavo]